MFFNFFFFFGGGGGGGGEGGLTGAKISIFYLPYFVSPTSNSGALYHLVAT